MMKSVRFHNHNVIVGKSPIPVVEKGSALIRILYAGICGTDVQLLRGYANFEGIPGHEFVGKVEKIHDEDICQYSNLLGKRVVASVNIACKNCLKEGHDVHHCRFRKAIGIRGHDGCHAEYLALPIENLIEVPNDDIFTEVSSKAIVLVEPLAASFHAFEQSKATCTDKIAIIGDGKLGMLCAWCFRFGFPNENVERDVTLFGLTRSCRPFLSEAGIKYVQLDPSRIRESAFEFESQFDVCCECAGHESGISCALSMVRPLGTIIMKSTIEGEHIVPIVEAVLKEVQLIGSRCGDVGWTLHSLLPIFLKNENNVKGMLYEKEFSLEEFAEAMNVAQRTPLKVVISFSPSSSSEREV